MRFLQKKNVIKSLTQVFFSTFAPTGLGQGEVLADEGLLSFSSGSSTDDILMFFADSKRRLCTGLDGAIYKKTLYWHKIKLILW